MTVSLEKEELMRIYCGMTHHQAVDWWNYVDHADNQVHPNTVQMFRDGGLIDDMGMVTVAGKALFKRISAIRGDEFTAPESVFNGPFLEALKAIDYHSFRHAAIKAHGLRAIHVKILRDLAVMPYQAYGTLREVYGHFALNELLELEMIQGEAERYSQIILSQKGTAFMTLIVSVMVLQPVDAQEDL